MLPERPREHQLKPFAHVPMAGVRRDRAVPEERALERAADDLADVDVTGDRTGVAEAHEQRLVALILRRG